MRKLFLLLAIMGLHQMMWSQNFNELARYNFDTPESYQEQESMVLACANYLFDHPTDHKEQNRQVAIQFILKWMSGSPDYTFEIGEESTELTQGNSDLMALYLAALAKAALDHSGESMSNAKLTEEAVRILVDYCADSQNKIKPSKKIKQLIKERKG